MQFFRAPWSCVQTAHSVLLLSVASWEWFRSFGGNRVPLGSPEREFQAEKTASTKALVLFDTDHVKILTQTRSCKTLCVFHSLFCRLLLWVCRIWGLCMAQKQMQSHPRSRAALKKLTISDQRLRTWSTSVHLWRRVLKGITQQLPVGALIWLMEKSSYTLPHYQCHHHHHPQVRVIISPVNPGATIRTRHAKYQMSVTGRTW